MPEGKADTHRHQAPEHLAEESSAIPQQPAPYSLEVQVLEGEVSFHNAGSLHPGPQNVLLSWNVGLLGYSIQVIQVTKPKRQSKTCFF